MSKIQKAINLIKGLIFLKQQMRETKSYSRNVFHFYHAKGRWEFVSPKQVDLKIKQIYESIVENE